jgi:hypothetical protein
MDWQAMALMLRCTKMHLKAWQGAIEDGRLILQRMAPGAYKAKLEALLENAETITTELQHEQDRLRDARSRKLASVLGLQ